jgi:hypothetical protein
MVTVARSRPLTPSVRPSGEEGVVNIGRRLIFLSVAAIHLACASTPSRTPAEATPSCPEYEVVYVGEGQGVIFPAGHGSGVNGYKYGTITQFWTPSSADVSQAEEGIRRYLEGTVPSLSVKFSKYIRQYTGFYHEGRKLIFVNFLCRSPSHPSWRCQPIAVDDGGDCYFSLEYDVTSGEYRHLWVNGEA